MKIKNWFVLLRDEGEMIARFGQARLMRRLNGRVELVGGTSEDRIEAREWISIFFHEIVALEIP
ncbi:MAG: hypothetical protein ACREIC_00865 [Limisphaerales bacterium]